MKKIPSVAIVGRPNVGKSVLFNRLCGKQAAIVDDMPGVTRDRLYQKAHWQDKVFQIIDTGGLFFNKNTENISADFQIEIELQADIAIKQAAVILFVVDNKLGITPLDLDIAHKLRSFKKPIIVVANKTDHPNNELDHNEFYNLSLGDVIPVSGKHGLNIGDLLDTIIDLLPWESKPDVISEDALKIAILGRPNVGKSSLFNAILGEERSIISDIAGTTHDALDTEIIRHQKTFRFIDTAGIRKKKNVDKRIEKLSIQQAIQTINNADICMLLIDPSEGVTKQEQVLANLIAKSGRACLFVLNKSDLISTEERDFYRKNFARKLKYTDYAPFIFISAKFNKNIGSIFPQLLKIQAEYFKKIPTPKINQCIQRAIEHKRPPAVGSRYLKLFYSTQIASGPPTFVVFVNDPTLIRLTYKRFLISQIREEFNFEGSPIILIFRKKTGTKKRHNYGQSGG
jgi:GTPase